MATSIDLAAARQFLGELRGGVKSVPVLCAVSGGLDSMCLLHLLSAWGREQDLTVTAAHFNHQLRGAASDEDEAFVRSWCEAKAIPCVCGRGDVRTYAEEAGQSLEEAARTLRYAFLEEQRKQLNCSLILTAHHADDNAETMLLNLIRGTGTRGLSGIPAVRGCIARPFLQVTRKELEEYAVKHGIPHVEDESNEEDCFSRNLLRHKVLPVLRELNPRAVEHMTCAANLLEQDEAALERMAEQLLRRVCRRENDALFLRAEPCLDAEDAVLTRAVHQALAQTAGRRKDLTAAHVKAVCSLLRGGSGKELSLPYGVMVRREADALVIWRKTAPPQEIPAEMEKTIRFGEWVVELSQNDGTYGLILPAGAVLTVTTWRRDDRMALSGSRRDRSLKRLCAERGISPAQRDLLPVLRVNDRAAAVPGVGVHVGFAARADLPKVFVTFHQKNEEKSYEK